MDIRLLKKVLVISLSLTVVVGAALVLLDAELKGVHSPYGIVSFELCAVSSNCLDIIDEWNAREKLIAAFGLGLDYLFLIVYSAVICCALVVVSWNLKAPYKRISFRLVWLAVAAGVFDLLENTFLTVMLLSGVSHPYEWYSTGSAMAKFACLGFVLVWFVILLVVRMFRIARPQELV